MRLRIFYQNLRSVSRKILIILGYYLGVFEVIRVILSKKYTPILLYHRILDNIETKTGKSSFYLSGAGILKSQFEKQMMYLNRKYKVISLNEYIERKSKKKNLSSLAVITFDDGFKDSAPEILKKYGFASTFFIFGGAFKKIAWRHMVYLLLDYAEKKNFSLEILPCKRINLFLNSPRQKKKSIFTIINILNNLLPDEKDNFINKLQDMLMIKEDISPKQIYLSYQDIQHLSRDGVHFGGHSVTHCDMSILSIPELLKETEESYNLIRDLTKQRMIPFAIPHGKFNEVVIKAVKQKGFFCNLTSEPGLNTKDQDIYKLRRIFINTRTLAEFVYKVSGAEMLLQKLLKLNDVKDE